MAVYDAPRSFAAPRAFIGRVFASVPATYSAIADWNEARATRRTFLKLSNRELFDLGLDRGWVEEVASRHRL